MEPTEADCAASPRHFRLPAPPTMNIKSLTISLIAVVAPLLTAGCDSDDLLQGERDVEVMFMWEGLAPDAAPEGMRLVFFPVGRGGIWRFDIAGRDGGVVRIPAGHYRMLAFNNDARNLDYTGTDSFEGYTAFCLPGDTEGGIPLVRKPTPFYAGHVDDLTVTRCGVRYVTDEGTVKDCRYGLVRCHPQRLTYEYTVRLEKVVDMANARRLSGVLGGVAEGVAPATGRYSSAPASVSFDLSAEAPDAASGGFTAFAPGTGMKLTLFATLTDGSTVRIEREITGEMQNNPVDKRVLIVVKGLKIPNSGSDTPIGGDGGLDVGIEGWTTVTIDLDSEIKY